MARSSHSGASFVGKMANMATYRDELYFIVCGQHPDWGYVDQPPLVPLLASLMHALFPKLTDDCSSGPGAGSCRHGCAHCETARKLGGGKWAQQLAGMRGVLMPTPACFRDDFLHGLASIDRLVFCAYALIGIVRDDNDRWWLPVGLVIGLGAHGQIHHWVLGYCPPDWPATDIGTRPSCPPRTLCRSAGRHAHRAAQLGLAMGSWMAVSRIRCRRWLKTRTSYMRLGLSC